MAASQSTVRLRVRELRESAGMTQTELGERAGIRRATVADIEAGRTQGIDFKTLARLADALDVNASYLIVHERDTKASKGKR